MLVDATVESNILTVFSGELPIYVCTNFKGIRSVIADLSKSDDDENTKYCIHINFESSYQNDYIWCMDADYMKSVMIALQKIIVGKSVSFKRKEKA